VLNYALRRKPELSGLVAGSPWLSLAFEPGRIQVALARTMSRIWPTFSQSSSLETSALSRDPEIERAYVEDPLVHDKISARMFMDVRQAGKWALLHAHEIALPLLLMHGDNDRLTSANASRAFGEDAPDTYCTLKIWQGFYHELHNEPEKQEVFTFMAEWFQSNLPQ